MNVQLEPGKYVVAVSGGVDSVVLLHLLVTMPELQLVVAHFDHGIRKDSAKDRRFVEGLSAGYGLDFYSKEGKLGPKASEAQSREARYKFLRDICGETGAIAIITAHHQDDLIETAFINLIRGTGRKGLSSLGSNQQIRRPLLEVNKPAIREYAQKHGLEWREDSTNLDDDYLRNYLRNQILPRMAATQRQELITILDSAGRNNKEIDDILGSLLYGQSQEQIDRAWFIALPHQLAREVLGHRLRGNGISFDRTAIERLVAGIKTLPAGAQIDINKGWIFRIGKDDIRIQRSSSV